MLCLEGIQILSVFHINKIWSHNHIVFSNHTLHRKLPGKLPTIFKIIFSETWMETFSLASPKKKKFKNYTSLVQKPNINYLRSYTKQTICN